MDKGVATGRKQIPVSVIIPTRNRPEVLKKTLITFGNQTAQAAEIIIIDGSEEFATKELICLHAFDIDGELIYLKAVELGAATQRNQGFALANFPFILFADDDVYLEPDCLHLLFQAMDDSPNVGGVSAMITNHKCLPMSKIITMDSLIAQFGAPAFTKIDVEGFELEVLKGLTKPVKYLSIEYTVPEQVDKLKAILLYLHGLDNKVKFNYS